MEQQERALRAYIDSVRDDPSTLAVVVVGSVAQGRERADSDVDVYLVVDDARFAEASADDRFAWVERQELDYPGSYIDIKLASPSYLEAAAIGADDPTRASFLGARVAFDRVAGLEDLLCADLAAARRRVGRARAFACGPGATVRRVLPDSGRRAR